MRLYDTNIPQRQISNRVMGFRAITFWGCCWSSPLSLSCSDSRGWLIGAQAHPPPPTKNKKHEVFFFPFFCYSKIARGCGQINLNSEISSILWESLFLWPLIYSFVVVEPDRIELSYLLLLKVTCIVMVLNFDSSNESEIMVILR